MNQGKRDIFKRREEYQCSPCFQSGKLSPILRHSLTLTVQKLLRNLSNLFLPVGLMLIIPPPHLATTLSSLRQLKLPPSTLALPTHCQTILSSFHPAAPPCKKHHRLNSVPPSVRDLLPSRPCHLTSRAALYETGAFLLVFCIFVHITLPTHNLHIF